KSPEQISQFFHEGTALGLNVLAQLAGQLLEELALARCQLGRDLDGDLDPLIAPPDPGAARDSLALDAEDRAGLRPGRNAQLALAVEGRHLDLASEGGLHERDGDLAQDVVGRSLEEGVRLHLDRDLEIARRAVRARLVPRAADDARGS